MAGMEKYTEEAIVQELRHNNRETKNNRNKDIDPDKSHLNYTYKLNHQGLSDYKYYCKRRDEVYIYGRGTAREKEAVTACGWVITCPKELLQFPDKIQKFFDGVMAFIKDRYGEKNILNAVIHHDEATPHLQTLVMPITKLDHQLTQHKTKKTTQFTKTESGRYEMVTRLVKDKDGNPIPIKNYAKITDYFDEKLSAADVFNKVELQHFHSDLQAYLISKGIEGKVITGATSGGNIEVQALKAITKATGMQIEEVKELLKSKDIIQELKTENKALKEKVETLENELEKVKSQKHEAEWGTSPWGNGGTTWNV